jgi:hypothetical protein
MLATEWGFQRQIWEPNRLSHWLHKAYGLTGKIDINKTCIAVNVKDKYCDCCEENCSTVLKKYHKQRVLQRL